MSDLREETLLRADHPEFIGNEWVRVDHPTCDPFQTGAPDLGWEGDERLVVYLHKEAETFVLWRLEANGEYMPISTFGIGQEITPASVNHTIRDLIRTDTRRGFNAYTTVMDAGEAVAKDQARRQLDWLHDFADKLLYGLSRSHLPGVDVTRIRQLPSRR